MNSALPTFAVQQAPAPQARALSALAAAHALRADLAHQRGDTRLATTLDELSIATYRAALSAWSNVATLQGDESANLDPALAISRLAHRLWRLGQRSRLDAGQRQTIRALLDDLPERQYPRRFEHPVLWLFRRVALIMLPAYLVLALVLAVQLPSVVQAHTHSDLRLRLPLLDLSEFPNNLIDARLTTPGNGIRGSWRGCPHRSVLWTCAPSSSASARSCSPQSSCCWPASICSAMRYSACW